MKYNVDDRVCHDDISNSNDWQFDSMSNHTEYPTVTYVTIDNTLTVSFENGSEYGTIMLKLMPMKPTKEQYEKIRESVDKWPQWKKDYVNKHVIISKNAKKI